METVITKYHRWANGRTELYQLASRIEQLEEQIDNLTTQTGNAKC